jgi:hypothetical protein
MRASPHRRDGLAPPGALPETLAVDFQHEDHP